MLSLAVMVKSRIKQILLKGHGDLKPRVHRQVLVSRSDTDETGRVRLSVRWRGTAI